MHLSYRFYYVFFRNLVSYKRFIVPTFIVSLGQPLFYLLTFGIGMGTYIGYLGGKPYLNFLVPGVIISSVMLSATFECLYDSFVKMVHQKLYDSLIATPVSAEDTIAGEIAWGAFRGLISGALMLFIAMLLKIYPVSPLNTLFLFVFMVFVGVMFSSLAMIVVSFAPNFDFFNYYTELIITPMLFFSGVFFPLDQFPDWMKVFAQFLPLTHAVDISRDFYSGQFTPGLGLHFLYLILLVIVAFFLGIRLMKRRLIK